jgi:hypothetical protein
VYDKTGMFSREQRRLAPLASPVLAPALEAPALIKRSDSDPEVVWNGVFRGLSGYAKANREIVFRVANTLRVSAAHAIEPPDYNDYQLQRINLHRRVAVSKHAPMVRFFGPAEKETDDRYRVLYTMMETETAHPDMIALMNKQYQEVWTPTRWNADVFKRSGLTLPIRIMPLGVNPHVYRPGARGTLPPCALLSTEGAGRRETPRGFTFVYCFLPSFRKGLDVLLPAFEDAFGDDPDVSLVLAVTHRPSFMADPDLDTPRRDFKSKIYILGGHYTERELANLYRSCDAYVTASRGEGWNLPMCEAAACGLPVVAPRNSAHLEILDDSTAFMFDTEGIELWGGGQKVSPWYEGVQFSKMGQQSRKQLSEQLRQVRADRTETSDRGGKFCDLVRSKYTWDRAAAHVVERLLAITA